MNVRLRPLASPSSLFLTACLIVCAGFNQLALPEAGAAVTVTQQRFPSTETNSFAAVTSQLDPGGNFYFYLGTEQLLRGLSNRLADFKTLLSSLPEMAGNDGGGVKKGLDLVTRLVSASGLEEISGIGMSGVARENGLYRSRVVVHHYKGRQKGLLWSLGGTAPHALEGLEVLPASTALAVSSDFDLGMLWNLIDEEVKVSDFPPAMAMVNHVREFIKSKYNTEWEQVLASVPGPFLVLLTLDDVRKFSIPAGGASVQIPHPGLVIMAKVKDETLYDLVGKSLPPDAPLLKTNKPGLKMQWMQLPGGLPFSPAVAQAGDYFLLSSHPRHIEELLSVKRGTTSGLKSTPEFKRLSADIDLNGNQFTFVSERFGKAIQDAMKSAYAKATNSPGAPPFELMQNFLGGQKVTFSVGSNTPEGWVMTGNGTQHPGALAAAPMMIAPTAIAAGLLLPALAKAKEKAQSVSCMNNMKQICLAARIYATDHNDTFAPNFLAMTNELITPKILFCPKNPRQQKPEATDWKLFDPADSDYEFVSPSTKDDMPDRVLIRCTLHGHVGLSDGSVHPRTDR